MMKKKTTRRCRLKREREKNNLKIRRQEKEIPREKGKERVQGSDTQQSKVSSDRLSVSKSLHKIHIIYAKGNPV